LDTYDERIVASGSRDKTIRLWDLEGNQVSRSLVGHKGGVNCVTFNPDGRILMSCGGDQKIKLWSKYPLNQLPFRKLSDFASCELLKTCNNTNINILQSNSPWHLPFDTLVIPVGKYGDVGFFGASFNQYLNNKATLQSDSLQISINRKMQELAQSYVKPEQPFIITLESDMSRHLFSSHKPIFIICMTVESESMHILESAVIATKATIDIAARYGCKSLFFSLLKAEVYQTTITEISAIILKAMDSQLTSLYGNEIEEITIIEEKLINIKRIKRIASQLFNNLSLTSDFAIRRYKKQKLCASTQGKALIFAARQCKKWSRDTKTNHEPLVLASLVIDPSWHLSVGDSHYDPVWADGINEGSWRRFLGGKDLIPAKVFQAYCQVLELNWYQVVDQDNLNGEYLFPSASVAIDQPPAGDASQFVKDVTIPDGTIMTAGEKFTKIWQIRNVGNVPWKGRFLERVGKCKGVALIYSDRRVPIPDTMPGELVDIVAELQAPYAATNTRATWKMIDSRGNLCFPDRYNCGLGVKICVIESE
jgi:Ig-like domain from next to BRCA1 gene/WD domain, G-beta repeat